MDLSKVIQSYQKKMSNRLADSSLDSSLGSLSDSSSQAYNVLPYWVEAGFGWVKSFILEINFLLESELTFNIPLEQYYDIFCRKLLIPLSPLSASVLLSVKYPITAHFWW